MVLTQDLGGCLDQLRRLAMPAHAPSHALIGIIGGAVIASEGARISLLRVAHVDAFDGDSGFLGDDRQHLYLKFARGHRIQRLDHRQMARSVAHDTAIMLLAFLYTWACDTGDAL